MEAVGQQVGETMISATGAEKPAPTAPATTAKVVVTATVDGPPARRRHSDIARRNVTGSGAVRYMAG